MKRSQFVAICLIAVVIASRASEYAERSSVSDTYYQPDETSFQAVC